MKTWILVFSFCIALGTSFAQFAGGSGTESDPWQVATAKQLDNVRNYLGEAHENKHFIQTADIDLGVAPWNQGEGWAPIGYRGYNGRDSYPNDHKFYGHYNGNGKVISNLFINRSDNNFQGLFGYSKGQIEDLGLKDVSVSGKVYIGGLVGENFGDISNCYITGSVSGRSATGGLVGDNDGTMNNCYSTGSVSGKEFTGGVVGWNRDSISNCYSTGNVNGEWAIGGLVGNNWHSISNCYSTGHVNGKWFVGGLVGENGGTIHNCFSSGNVDGEDYYGSLVGTSDGTIINCFSTGSVGEVLK